MATDRDELPSEVEEIAQGLRQEPYSLLTNDCLVKSIRFARSCRRRGIPARVVLCLGLASARLPGLGRRITLPAIHAWGEVGGQRIEVSRPLGSAGMLDIVPVEIRPLVKLRVRC